MFFGYCTYAPTLVFQTQSILPDALTKGDYFRTRAPSRSPSRRPPRKGALKNDQSTGAADSKPSNDVRLPQIGSSSGSDKSDKIQNGDPMTGEVTVSFIDYRTKDVTASMKRSVNPNPMHNVKIIQYIGQGKAGTRTTHEFWMQSESKLLITEPFVLKCQDFSNIATADALS